MASSAAVAAEDIECAEVQFDGGDGSAENPYQVSTAEQLQCVDDDRDAHYELVDDVDLSSIDNFEPIAEPYSDQPFTGSFDGNGHEIQNLTIDRPSEFDVGLFRWARSSAEIRNVSVVNADVTGGHRTGILLAFQNRGATVDNVATSGTVSGTRHVGGVVGRLGRSTTSNVSTTATVGAHGDFPSDVGGVVGSIINDGVLERAHAAGTVSNSDRVGGVVGSISTRGVVRDSYSEATVEGTRDVGGIVGEMSSDTRIETAYVTGTVDGRFRSGGIAGNGGGDVVDSYWDVEATGTSGSAGGTGLETADMTGTAASENMEGFDFDETWATVDDAYPQLRPIENEDDENETDDRNQSDGISVVLEPTEAEIQSGETVTLDLSIENADQGVGAYDVNLTSADPAVTFENISLRNDPTFPVTEVSENGTHLRVEVGMGENQHPAADEIVLAEITAVVDSEATPDKNVTIQSDDAEVADEDVNQYNITTEGATTLSIVDPTAIFEIDPIDDREISSSERSGVSFEATVTNTGDGNETKPVTLQIENETVATENATINVSETATVTFERVTIDQSPGEYNYTIVTGDDEQSGTLEIVEGVDPVVGDTPPQDPDGDGIFEDIDGDGQITIFDVQILFDNLDNDAVQNNPGAYNFGGQDNPDEVTIFDVQGLFGQI